MLLIIGISILYSLKIIFLFLSFLWIKKKDEKEFVFNLSSSLFKTILFLLNCIFINLVVNNLYLGLLIKKYRIKEFSIFLICFLNNLFIGE